jgi:hypothetical protein
MQYELPIARLVVGTLNSSDGKGFGIHARNGKKSVLERNRGQTAHGFTQNFINIQIELRPAIGEQAVDFVFSTG